LGIRLAGLLAAAALSIVGCTQASRTQEASDPHAEPTVALLTSLPIVWPEAGDVSGLLAESGPPHWALAVLGAEGTVHPLDTLTDERGHMRVAQGALLVMAQPYPLSPQDNVALDRWVQGGGCVLLFADPMLTFESHYALGDRRRPQDIALLSPILTRWGLELRFDETQPAGERVAAGDLAMPVNLPGTFAIGDETGRCALNADGLIADCRIGQGRMLAVADAALLEPREDGPDRARANALNMLLKRVTR
jgi:hypothetical protein